LRITGIPLPLLPVELSDSDQILTDRSEHT